LLTVVLYAGAMRNGFTHWDDDLYVTANSLITELSIDSVTRAFTTKVDANYLPLTLLTFMVEYAIVGLDPWLYHLTNVVLHGITAWLVWTLGCRWFGNRPAALLAAVLFAVHPLRVESVAWVTERKDVLCAVFYLGTLVLWDRWSTTNPARTKLWFAALCVFVLALLSKVMAISVPAVLVVYHLWRRDLTRRRLLAMAPLWVLALGFTALGVATQSADGAVKELHGGTPIAHVGTVVKALGFYAVKLVAPVQLSPLYIFRAPESVLEPQLLLGVALVGASVVGAAISWRRERTLFFAIGFFWAIWLPVSGIVPSGMPVADRYMYLPSLALLWPLALWIARRRRTESPAGARIHRWARVAVAAFVVACALLTVRQIGVWRNGVTLWTAALAEDADNPVAYAQLSTTHLRAGRYREALENGKRAFELGYQTAGHSLTLAMSYRGLDQPAAERAVVAAVLAAHPDDLRARVAMARHLMRADRLDECERLLAHRPGDRPDDPGLLAARGDLECARGNRSRALELYRRSLERHPSNAEGLVAVAACLLDVGDEPGARAAIAPIVERDDLRLYPDTRRRLAEVMRRLAGQARDARSS